MSQPLTLVLALVLGPLVVVLWWGWHGARERERERRASSDAIANLQRQLDELELESSIARNASLCAQAEARIFSTEAYGPQCAVRPALPVHHAADHAHQRAKCDVGVIPRRHEVASVGEDGMS